MTQTSALKYLQKENINSTKRKNKIPLEVNSESQETQSQRKSQLHSKFSAKLRQSKAQWLTADEISPMGNLRYSCFTENASPDTMQPQNFRKAK